MIDNKVLYTLDGPFLQELLSGPCLANMVEIREGYLCFMDPTTPRGHMFPGELLREAKDGFDWHWVLPPFGTLEAEDRGTIEARVVTLARYEELASAGIIRNPITPRPRSDQELWEWYRRMARG
ncbi:MAG: hypothetical protein ACM3X6_02895 [Patescibacteria group bacterium]